jgi:predicted MPP superfamily phosphohydrolase
MEAPYLFTRRTVVFGLGLTGVAAASTATYAAEVEAFSLDVTRYALEPPGWPAGQRLLIAVIADLHAGGPNMGHRRVRHVVETTNALSPDLTLLLGDYVADHMFVTERVPSEVWAGELGQLSAPHGVWAILGNHDWWRDVREIRRALAIARIPVLENDAVRLGPDGRRFWLAGIGDQLAHPLGHRRYRGVDDLPATLRRVRGEDPVVLMAHEPDIFPKVPSRVALTLAGHTHGGQIRIPGVWQHFVPSKYGARYAYGHVVEDDRHLIVSGGIGTSAFPARLGVPPEIVLIELDGETANFLAGRTTA